MEQKTFGRVSAKQSLLTKRVDLSYGITKKESEKKSILLRGGESDTRQVWNETIGRLRRTSAPAELPPIKDALPKLTVKARARTLSLRGGEKSSEMHAKQWNTSYTKNNKICENQSNVRALVSAKIDDTQKRPLSALTSSNNSVTTCCLGIKDDNSILDSRKLVGRKCLTQEALICHELGLAEMDEDSADKKKDMIVRWLNSEALSCSNWEGLEKLRSFPQL